MQRKIAEGFVMMLLVMLSSVASALTIPKPTGFVNDYVGILNAEERTALEDRLHHVAEGDGPEVAVAIVQSLDGYTVEDYATELFKAWEIGKEDKDNGVLFLLAPNERKVRIQTGYGLEGVLPDVVAKHIISNLVTPKYRAGDKAGAISAGVDAILARLKREVESPSPAGDTVTVLPTLLILLVIIIVVVAVVVLAVITRDDDDEELLSSRHSSLRPYRSSGSTTPQPSSPRSDDSDLVTGAVIGGILGSGGSGGSGGDDGGGFGGFGGGDTGGGGASGDL